MANFFTSKKFSMLIINLTILYSLLLILAYNFQRHLQYFPRGVAKAPAGFEEIKIKTQDNVEIMLWQKIPQEYKKIIVYFHGNAGNVGDRSYRLESFAEKGYGVVAVSYRGYYGSQGSPSEVGFINDAKAVIDYLASKKIPKQNLILFGESIGSGVVAQIGANFSTEKKSLNQAPQNDQIQQQEVLNSQTNSLDAINVANSELTANGSSDSVNIEQDATIKTASATPNDEIKIAIEQPTQVSAQDQAQQNNSQNIVDDYFLIVLDSPFFNIEEVAKKTYPFLPIKLLLKDRFDSNLFAPNITSAVLVLHGDEDRIVPIVSGKKLFSLITAKKKFVELRGRDHIEANPDFIIEQIEAFSLK